MESITFDRKKLYEAVWATPLSKLSESYGVTIHQLKKICTELDVPTPRPGYWTKLRFGKTVKKVSLPDSDKSTLEFMPGSDKQIELNDKLPKGYKPIKVSMYLKSLHPLVQQTYDYLNEGRNNRDGRRRARGSSILDVSVTPKNLKRAMRILDALVKEIERQGYSVQTTSYNRLSKSYIKMEEEEIYFHLHEEGKRIKKENPNYSWDEYDHIYTGKLILGLSDSIYWFRTRSISDTKTKSLEDRLDRFFVVLFEMFDKEKAERLESEIRQREAEKERQRLQEIADRKRKIKEEREQRFQAELNRRQELENSAKSLTTSNQIYQFIAEVEKKIKKENLNDIQLKRFKDWKEWAKEYADGLNPVNHTIRSILGR